LDSEESRVSKKARTVSESNKISEKNSKLNCKNNITTLAEIGNVLR